MALAFRRVLLKDVEVDIGSEGMTFWGTRLGHSYRMKTPVTVEDFAVMFDDKNTRGNCKPFDFSLQLKRVDAEALLKTRYR